MLPDTPKEFYKHPLVQELLNSLPMPTESTSWKFSFPIAKKQVDQGKLIIAGYASVEIIDSQDDLIPIPVLKDAWERFFANKDFRLGTLMHSNVPVIKILKEYIDSNGEVWKSEVDKNGLRIVAEVRDDIQKGKETRELIEKEVLTGFSIGGEALASTTICEGKCYTRIDKMDLHEIAVVDRPANKSAIFTIVKSDRLRKLTELTGILPNLIISPGVVKIGGSTAEVGKGNDFDLFISATKGSFVDRAIQTRIYNKLREKDRLDLWKDIQVIHEPEGLGPHGDYYPVYDLVLLRAPFEKKEMTMKGEVKVTSDLSKAGEMTVEDIKSNIKDLQKERSKLNDKIWPPSPKSKLTDVEKEAARLELDFIDGELGGWKQALGIKLAGSVIVSKAEGLVKLIAKRLDKAEKPPKSGWDKCISRAGGIASINDPEAFCGNLWFNDRPKWDSFIKSDDEIDISKKVERRGDKWCVIHCSGPDVGKPIKCFPTKEQALAMHRAIQVHKVDKCTIICSIARLDKAIDYYKDYGVFHIKK